MAHLLQGLIVLFFVCRVTAAPAFSHRVHLKLKLTCVTCHNAAPSSVRASDNNLPKPDICASCHKTAVGIKLPRPNLVTKFNHQLHLKMGNLAPVIAKAIDSGAYLSAPGEIRRHLNTRLACAACHRALDQSDEVSPAAFPQMADCLVCHNKIDPPFSCAKCHDERANLKPVSHVPDFLDRHTKRGTIQSKESCAVCHGRQFTCLGCH